jgi:hypothetical protein
MPWSTRNLAITSFPRNTAMCRAVGRSSLSAKEKNGVFLWHLGVPKQGERGDGRV